MERREGWSRVARTSAFQELMQKKKSFLIPATIFFMVFYFGLPVLAAFTTILQHFPLALNQHREKPRRVESHQMAA